MHFGPERAARAAEVEAPSSTITQVAVHRQPIPSSISGIPFARDSQIALISERSSMPCLCQPASKPFKKGQSSDASTMERPASPVATVSSRRSVSSMKRLLPLRLRATAPQPKSDLASWLDSTVPSLEPLTAFNYENKSSHELEAYSPIPWMSSSQDVRLSCSLPPDRYRETPIYSGPGSPRLSRAYFSDEEPCYNCSPRGSICDELCILSNYEDAEASSPYSQESVVDFADADRIRSIETSTTSFASSRISSTRCHGGCVPPDEATWMKSSLRSWTEGRAQEAASSNGINEVHEEQNPFEAWLECDSSRSGSSFSSDEVLDVLATKLSPAKAHVVELHKVLQALPNLTEPPKSNLQGRPATPYRISRRRSKLANCPMLAPKETFDDRTVRPRQRQRATLLSSTVFDLQWEHATHSPPPSPMASISFGVLEDPFSEHQCQNAEPEIVEQCRTIIDSIHDVVYGFPQQMLFLDTPCVADIRHQNHVAQGATDPRSFSNPSSGSSTYSLPLDRPTLPTHRRRTATKFFAPFLRATTRKSSFLQSKVTSSYANRSSSCLSTGWRSLTPQPDTPPPELSVFRHIFPDTQDWWRSVLYAHLVAFNYVRENHSPPQRNTSGFPSKACQTLGISCERSIPAADANSRLTDLEENLMSCITWITNCMAGKSNAQRGINKFRNDYDRDHILVRALAEIVKVCESGGGGEGNVPQVH